MVAYLGLVCDSNDNNNHTMSEPDASPAYNVSTSTDAEGNVTAELLVNTSRLTPGAHYRLCTDLDGYGSGMKFGDTGLKYFILPVEDIQTNYTVFGREATLNFTCAACFETKQAKAYLATYCDTPCDQDPSCDESVPDASLSSGVGVRVSPADFW